LTIYRDVLCVDFLYIDSTYWTFG